MASSLTTLMAASPDIDLICDLGSTEPPNVMDVGRALNAAAALQTASAMKTGAPVTLAASGRGEGLSKPLTGHMRRWLVEELVTILMKAASQTSEDQTALDEFRNVALAEGNNK